MSALTTSPEHLGSLNRVLWTYRSLLDRVELLLETQLIFASRRDDDRIGQIVELIEETATAIADVEIQREQILAVADQPPTLSQLCEELEAPWDAVFRDHQRWFAGSIDRIGRSVDQNRLTMTAAMDSITQITNGITRTPVAQTYDRRGQRERAGTRPVLHTGLA